MIVQASRSIAYKKLMENAGDNEFVQAIDKIHEIKKKVAPVKKSKLHKAQTRNTNLQKRTGVGKTKFHKRQTYLQRTKATPKKKRRKKWNGNDSFGGMIFNEAKGFLVSSIKASPALVKAVGAKVITIMAPIIILALGVNLLMTGVSMIMSFGEKSTFVMGTYSSMDKDLSKAVSIYTNLAYTDNKYLLQCGSSQSWKTGLSSFGVGNSILKNYKDVPQEFNYNGTSNYDFSYWKFYSFLCAYFYRVDNYWEMNDEVEKAIRQLYDIQYEFRHQYINGSHWVHKPSYEFSNGYNPCYATVIGNAQIAWGVFDFKGGAPSELADFAEKIDNNMYRIYYSLDNLEVLNANDDKSATGWYFLNQCSTITDPNGNYRNGLYTYNTTNYSYFNDGFGIVGAWQWWFPRTRVFANYDLPAYISPTDTVLWLYSFNDRDIGGITIAQRYDELIHEYTDSIREDPNIAIWDRVGFYNQIYEMASYYDSYTDFGLCSFYKMYDWKKECKLEYGMYSKMSFDEAIRKMFLSKENGAELYAYYLTLLGDESSGSNFNYRVFELFQ